MFEKNQPADMNLKELQIDEDDKQSNDAVDPRWDKLKGLITEKNT